MNKQKLVVAILVSQVLACSIVAAQSIEEQSAPAQSNPETDELSLDDILGPATTEPSSEVQPEAAAPTPEPEPTPEPQQSAAETVASPKPRSSLVEEIVVTAQRREENLQDVPISVTVLNQEQIANANITNASDLALYTPSLSANTLFGAENASFAIRGFVQDVRTTASVATYFAEVIAPRGQTLYTSGDGAGPGELFDLENVQVLKGPQGTLFGRNSTGGAVLFVPKKPTHEFGGHLELSAGEFGLERQESVVNVPVSESLRLRLGVDRQQRSGYLNNVTDFGDSKLADVNYSAFRLSGIWDVNEKLENYTVLSYLDSETANYAPKLFACNPDFLPRLVQAIADIPADGLPPFSEANPLILFFGPACEQQLANQRATGQNGFYDVASAVASPLSLTKQKRVLNTLTWDIRDNLTFKNILAYSHLYTEAEQTTFGSDFRVAYDPDPARRFEVATATLSPDFPTTDQETWVGEVQLQGSSFDARLNWQTGLYYENSRPNGATGFRSPSLISCDPTTISGNPAQANCFDPTLGILGSILDLSAATEYTNKAVFGQGTFDINDQFSVTLGTRYTWDRTEAYGRKVRYNYLLTVPQAPIETITRPEVKSEKLTGVADLRYRPTDAIMTYLKYSQGYRQGGTNTQAEPGLDTYAPETVKTYELGAKTEFDWIVPGRFSFAVFYNDFTDMQLKSAYISSTSGAVPTIFNAGKSEIKGVEAEATFLLREDLTFNVSYSHLDTELLEQENHLARVQGIGGIIAGATYTQTADIGDPLPYSPKHNLVASLLYRLPVAPRFGEVNLSTTYSYTSEQQVVATSASPFAVLDSRQLFNVSLNWGSIFGRPVDLSIFGTNLGNEEYFTYVQGGYNSLGFESGSTGQPRMFGLRLKYRFGEEAGR